jgi:hypothetical protein
MYPLDTMLGLDSDEVTKSTGVILVALLIAGFVPIIGLIRLVPMLKEVILGAAVVVAFTGIGDTKEAVKFALVTGMLAALVFNVIYIPGQIFLGGVFGAASDGASASGMAMFRGLGAATNLIGFVLFSPFGYAIGGVIGGVLND